MIKYNNNIICNKISLKYVYIYKIVSNKRQKAEPIRPNIFVATHMTPGRFINRQREKICMKKILLLINFQATLKTKIVDRKRCAKRP